MPTNESVYDVGDEVVMSVTITVNGTLTDPSAMSLKIIEPDGTQLADVLIGSMINPSTGLYEYTHEVDQSGRYNYRFEATGTVVHAEAGSFYVKENPFT